MATGYARLVDDYYNVMVLGLDELNHRALTEVATDLNIRFHPLLSVEELVDTNELRMRELLDKAVEQIENFGERVDAIVGYWDFPVSSMIPMLARRYGLRSADLRAVLACEHKYWSRLEQQQAIDEYPAFGLVALEDQRPPEHVSYPMWVKPVKSFSSELAYRVEDDEQFRDALSIISEGIGRVGEPFQFVLDQVELPRKVEEAGGQACLAEEAVTGQQLTVEGYNTDGQAYVYGIIDSHLYEGTSSFERYQYPSTLPEHVQRRLEDISLRVVNHIGLGEVAFNIEYFWDEETDTIRLLEINPRHSQSHAYLFHYVDGAANHRVMVRLALGLDPDVPQRQGEYAVAAKYFVRRFSDGVVTGVPSDDDVKRLENEIDGCAIGILVRPGDRLSELPDQDSYSYALATVHLGAGDEDELRRKYEHVVSQLPFTFEQPSDSSG